MKKVLVLALLVGLLAALYIGEVIADDPPDIGVSPQVVDVIV